MGTNLCVFLALMKVHQTLRVLSSLRQVSEIDESWFKNLYLIAINIHTLYWRNSSFHACLICGVQRMNTQKARFQLQRRSAMWSCCIWLEYFTDKQHNPVCDLNASLTTTTPHCGFNASLTTTIFSFVVLMLHLQPPYSCLWL